MHPKTDVVGIDFFDPPGVGVGGDEFFSSVFERVWRNTFEAQDQAYTAAVSHGGEEFVGFTDENFALGGPFDIQGDEFIA